MSGLEIVGVVAAGFSVAKLSIKLFETVSRRAKDNEKIQGAANDLGSKIQQLYQISSTISVTLDFQEKKIKSTQKEKEELAIIETIWESLKACEQALQKLEIVLKELPNGKLNVFRSKWELQRLSFARTEKTFDTQLQVLQVCLTCFQIITAAGETHETRIQLKKLNKLKTKGDSYLDQLSYEETEPRSSTNPTDRNGDDVAGIPGNINDIENMKRCLNAATMVQSTYDTTALKEQYSISGTGFEDDVSNGVSNKIVDDEPVPDPTLNFDDTTPREVLSRLIDGLRRQVVTDMLNHHFRQAESNQIQAIELLEEQRDAYKIPFEDYDEMQCSLAEIYHEQKKFDKAEEVLINLRQRNTENKPNLKYEQRTTMDHTQGAKISSHYLILSHVNYNKYCQQEQAKYLDAAMRDAKRALIARLRVTEAHDPSIQEAVGWFIKMYKKQGKEVHAKTYRDLYLPNDRMDRCRALPDLIHAIENGKHDMIETLLQQEINLDMCYEGKTPIMFAIDSGIEKTVRKLLEKGAQAGGGLLYAVCKDDARMTALLLDLDADLDYRGNGGWTALHLAAHYDSEDVMQVLLNHKADVNAACSAGKTTLHYTAETNRTNLAEILLQHGADIKIEDSAQRTCLHIAIIHKRYDFVKMLLDRGVPSERYKDVATSMDVRNLLYQYEESRKSKS